MNPGPEVKNVFPADYTFPYGEERPFAPSLGHTQSNGAYDPATLSGSGGCGSSGCHEQILEEWTPSAHRYASADLAFQEVQKLMYTDLGPEGTRYCAGCHDPIALFSGSKNANVEGLTSPGADEGVSCISCHAIIQTDVRGNADYTISQPLRYVGERRDSGFNKWMSDFLIRAYPKQAVVSFSKPMYKTAEYCGACHKQFIDEDVNQIGWVQLQNQYDNWKESRWHDLRHTWASWHAQSGTSTQELQELGGWSCKEMVQRYAHLGGDHLKKAASRISGTNLAQSVKYEGLRLVVSR